MSEPSSQERYAPTTRCFGCGLANPAGLRIKSFARGSELICERTPARHHEAFDGVLNGGIIGTLFDCYCNWTAAYYLMTASELEARSCTVTAKYCVVLKRPTPSDGRVLLRGHVVEAATDHAVVEGEIEAGGKATATCRGVFVAVREGHPAFHRW